MTITVEKYLCGPEYPDTTAVDDWRAACTNPHPGVTFTAEHIGGPIVTETTGDDSAVTFKVLPGDVYIQATPPDSSAKGYAWCGVGATGAPPAYVNAGRLSAGEPAMPLSNINPELVYSCEWFTVPLEVTSDIADDSGYVTIFKWRCPEHFDSSGKTLEHLLEACPNPQYDVPIAIYYETGTPYIQRTQPEKGTAVARFEDLAPGKVGIGELNPTGNELQRVICSTSVVGQTMFGVVDGSMEYPVADGGIAATIEGGKALTCHFFNVPAEDEDTPPSAGSVSMRKMICPPGFAAVKSSSIDISIYCTYEAYVEFKLTQGETTLSAITGVDGLAKFSGIKAGALRITELPREGYDAPLVFCRTTTVGESAIGELEPVTVDNWGIAYELPEGTYLECVWANMPSSTTSTDPSTILLHAYTCPEGTGPYQLLGTLLTECTVRGEGTAFAAGPPLGKALEFKTNASGDATITNLPAGPNNVFQIEVDGYRPLTAWCDYDPSATSEADDFGRLGADPLSAYMSGGNTLECYWFDVAYVEPVTVTLLKRVCPDDYALVGASREDILFNCTTSPSGVEFRVREDSSTGLQAAAQLYDATLATDATGSAVFYDVPVAPLIISEQSTLYDAVYVYCGQSVSGEPPAIYSELEIANEAVRYEVEPGADVYCYWINVESPPATVIIHKHGCPETAFPKGHDLEDDLAICPVPLVDVTFTVGAAAAELSDVTDVDGLVSFEHVAPGLLFIGETPPAGYTKAIVYCAIQPKGGQQGAFAPVPVTKLAIEQDIVSGDTLECYWFNTKKPFHPDTPSPTPTPGTGKPNTPVPTPGTGKPGTPTPDPDAPATLVLTTYTCPAGYDVYAFEADLAQDCKKVTPGIKVALADLDEDSAGIVPVEIETTDDDGVVIFSELEPGPWLLTEALPETTSTAFVASCTSDQRDLEAEPLFTPLTYLGPDGQIGIVIVAGETLECDSYAIPEETAADDGK